MEDFFGEVISVYTREDAIEDGTLIDVSETAKEAGFKFPVAVTSGVWGNVVEADEKAISMGESNSGRLWDVLFMLHFEIKRSNSNGNSVNFKVIATEKGREKYHNLRAVIGPGDTSAPVITIMLPHED